MIVIKIKLERLYLNTYIYTFHYDKDGSVLYFDLVFFVIFKP